MRKSKYVGKQFDNNWVCTGCNLAANYGHGTKHNRYWYAFQRRTVDGLFDKWIRVEATEATKIYKGELLVEDVCQLRESQLRESMIKTRSRHGINYIFVNKKSN